MDQEDLKYSWKVHTNMMVHHLSTIQWPVLDFIAELQAAKLTMKSLYAFIQLTHKISITAIGLELIKIKNMYLLMHLVALSASLNNIILTDSSGKITLVYSFNLMDKLFWMQLQVEFHRTLFPLNLWTQEW